MYEMKWIELTGLANAAYQRDVVLPACERRAAQHAALAAMADARTGRWRAVVSLLRRRGRRLVGTGRVGRTTTTALPDA